jgi:hypothetical protein
MSVRMTTYERNELVTVVCGVCGPVIRNIDRKRAGRVYLRHKRWHERRRRAA